MTARFLVPACLFLALAAAPLRAQDGPPRDNPYDVIGKVFAPFWSVLLNASGENRACAMTIKMTEVTGRLPKQMEGAVMKAAVEFPDKVRLQAPVMGEDITVCRNGNDVWAMPGQKVEYLLKQFKTKPGKTVKKNGPLFLPVTAQQAFFLPALFTIANADVAQIDAVNGEECRLITAGLMPQLAKAAKAEGFQAQLWVSASYQPRRVKITQPDFTATVEITDLKFGPSLQAAMWQPPAGVTDIYHTDADHLDGVLFVVMNSLKMNQADKPWEAGNPKATPTPLPTATPAAATVPAPAQ
jgi:hypothetical protein